MDCHQQRADDLEPSGFHPTYRAAFAYTEVCVAVQM